MWNKNIGWKKCFLGLSILVILFSCETNQDTFKEFIQEGETIYIGTADTVLLGYGFEKLRFWVALNADPKISQGLLTTTDNSISFEFDVERTKAGKDTVSFDLEIPEGEYTFGLFLLDEKGNSSVRKEVPVKVYGANYQSSLINRAIRKIEAFANTAVLHWAEASPEMVLTRLTYESEAGAMQSLEINNHESETILEGYRRGGALKIQSVFKPNEAAVEDFDAPAAERTFPVEYIVDKSSITALKLSGDASEGCYGSSYANLFNDNTGDFWHSCEDEIENAADLYPLVMSFNMGSPVNVSRFRLDERQDCCGGRSPGAYQIWGTNEIGNAETIDIDQVSLEEWETDAVQKGWVKLVDVTGNTDASFEVELSEDRINYQFIRLVGISSIDGGLAANFSEFTFWGK